MIIQSTESFRNKPPQEVISNLQSNVQDGLAVKIIKERLLEFGYNEVISPKTSILLSFLKRFWGLSAWMLELTIVISWILHRYSDVIIILSLLVINAFLGFYQDQKVTKAVDQLKQKLNITTRVLRSKIWSQIPARELVPGDIIRLRGGDMVPADSQINEGELSVDQSAITGESDLASISTAGIIYAGSIIKRGESLAIVLNTGKNTFYGKTTELVSIAHSKLHMEKLISKTVQWLFFFVLILVAITLVVAVYRSYNLLDLLPLILVLLLSAIPVALPVMFTVTMAVGSMELLKKGVLITRLSASEDVANMDMLCTDKTGTITMNQLTITHSIPYGTVSNDELILMGSLASQEANQDSIDLAFLNSKNLRKISSEQYKILKFRPFDSSLRRTEADILHGSEKITIMKGAVNTIIGLCEDPNQLHQWIDSYVDQLAKEGSRSIAIARKSDSSKIHLLGLIGLSDPPRPDSQDLIHQLQALGITVKLVTGDNINVAQKISADVGIGPNLVHGLKLKSIDEKNPQETLSIIEHTNGFAEIFPEDKFKIVQLLQNAGHTVGMTGDGVNDAPALHQAEVGIAVSSATDVAKESASVVLTSAGLINIIDLVKTGRSIYKRIKIWILNKLIRSLLKNLVVVIAFLITGLFITNAFSMILILLLNDFMKIAIATDNIPPNNKPDSWDISNVVKSGIILGLISTCEVLGILYLGDLIFGIFNNIGRLQMFTFVLLLFSAVFQIFDIREKHHFWHSKPSKALFYGMLIDFIAGILIATFGLPSLTPIPLIWSLYIIGMTLICFLFLNDAIKIVMIRKKWIDW